MQLPIRNDDRHHRPADQPTTIEQPSAVEGYKEIIDLQTAGAVGPRFRLLILLHMNLRPVSNPE